MLMGFPKRPKGCEGQIRERYHPVFVSFTLADMDTLTLCIHIPHLKGQGFAKAKPHGVGGQKKYPVTEYPGGGNDPLNLIGNEDVGKGLNFGRSYNFNPFPFFFLEQTSRSAEDRFCRS
jgi:hypothetical protein